MIRGVELWLRALARLRECCQLGIWLGLLTVSVNASSAQLIVLGVAQDAGYPQIDCYEPRCLDLWEDLELQSGATSLAVVNRQGRVLLFDAAPELPEQLYVLWRHSKARVSDIDGIFLTHAHMGHYLGLAHLGKEAVGAREVPVYVMPRFKQFLERNGPWSQLVTERNIVLREVKEAQWVTVNDVRVKPMLVPHRDEYSETVGFVIEARQRVLYLPDIDKWGKWAWNLAEVLETVDWAFIDASFFGQGELPGRDMSLIPHPTVSETMTLLADIPEVEKSKVRFIHMNHTNPLLRKASPEREAVLAAGFGIARPGEVLDLAP